jgi:redox-sensitive bicupin YhaK (pirin superfamily)
MSKKKISFSTQGLETEVGGLKIYRLLPARYADAVGPFVLLDYIPPTRSTGNKSANRRGTGAHPHRGIATLTYLLNGEAEHFDSQGHHSKVSSGGAQWMKSGSGIIHDENVGADPQSNENLIHGFQFWINLPSQIKTEAPHYISFQHRDIPKKQLSDKRGWIKVIAGAYEELRSAIPEYSRQYLYHIHLEAGKQFTLATEKQLEYAAFLPSNKARINETEFGEIEFIEFDREDGIIEIDNPTDKAIDVILFGGERYAEPIVAKGPFVMNSEAEIAQAYRDFHAGKYGKINYAT